MTFALVEHEWYDDRKDWRQGSGDGPFVSSQTFFEDKAESLQTVPEGLAGSGTLNVMGEWVPATFVSSRVDETFKLTAVVPAMEWPAIRLSGMAAVGAGGDEWASVGPMVKLGGVQVGGVAQVVLQGYVDLIGIRQWFAAEVTDKGVDLRLTGRVYGGVEMSVRATTPAAGALQLRSTSWKVDGFAVESSLQALAVRMHAEARDICGHGKGSSQCSYHNAQEVQRGGWFHLCSLTTSETLRHGQLGYAVADWRRATVKLSVWVSGHSKTLTINDVDLSDWTRASRTLAQGIVPHVVTGGAWSTVPAHCSGGKDGRRGAAPWNVWTLPEKCDTLSAMLLPTTSSLAAALERDNAMIVMQEEDHNVWARHQGIVARARYRAAVQVFNRRRAAWEADEVVRRAIGTYSRLHKEYSRVSPTYIRNPAGAPTDSYTRYLAATAPLGGQRMHTRLLKITARLDKLQKNLESRASKTIAESIAQERAALLKNWPVSAQQEAALLRAKERHALAVSGRARRLAQTHREQSPRFPSKTSTPSPSSALAAASAASADSIALPKSVAA